MTGGSPLRVEATGETVGEAKWQALRELERLDPRLDRSSVRFQIVSEGERGLLGVGYSPARVIATAQARESPARAGTPAQESEAAGLVRDLLDRVADALGVECRIDVAETDDEIVASCSGRDLALLIGRHGQTIDAIQYLANAIVARALPDARKHVVVDAAGYRARREAALERVAVESAERALATGSRVELQSMSAVERKVVHLRLKDYPGVATTSEGTEPNRYVVVAPAANAARPRQRTGGGGSGEPSGSPASAEELDSAE